MKAKFVFDGIEGWVNKSGWVQWATFSCDMGCAIGELKLEVEKAYRDSFPTARSSNESWHG